MESPGTETPSNVGVENMLCRSLNRELNILLKFSVASSALGMATQISIDVEKMLGRAEESEVIERPEI